MSDEKCSACGRFWSAGCMHCMLGAPAPVPPPEQEAGCWSVIEAWCLANDARIALSFGGTVWRVSLFCAGGFKVFEPSGSRLDALSQAAQWCALEKV